MVHYVLIYVAHDWNFNITAHVFFHLQNIMVVDTVEGKDVSIQ